jgi:hypothetical protein
MEAIFYRSHLIYARAERTACLDYWVPVARVSRNEKGAAGQTVLDGPSAWCKSEEEATLRALTMAKRWIDDRQRKLNDTITIQAAGDAASVSWS